MNWGGRGVASARVPLGLNTSPHISEPTSEPQAVPPDTIWIAGGEHLPKGKDAALFTTCPEDDSDISYTRTSTTKGLAEALREMVNSAVEFVDDPRSQRGKYATIRVDAITAARTALARWEGKGKS